MHHHPKVQQTARPKKREGKKKNMENHSAWREKRGVMRKQDRGTEKRIRGRDKDKDKEGCY
jgi:hypothetical protein